MTKTTSALLELQNICVKYGEKQVLNNINFKIQENEKIAIVGKSGCGKSTLVNTLMGVVPFCSG